MAMVEREGKEILPGGVRTFPLISLAGALAAMFADALPWLFPSIMLGLVLLLGAHRLGLRADLREGGFTTEVAAVVTLLLGGLASSRVIPELENRLLTSSALAVVVTPLLSIKPRLHAAVCRVSLEDIFATLQLLVVAIIVLPLLPDEAYGPFGAINPQQIGKMILLVGAVSFTGYVASRLLGPGRGLTVTGFVGGLASSTAVTFAMSRRARRRAHRALGGRRRRGGVGDDVPARARRGRADLPAAVLAPGRAHGPHGGRGRRRAVSPHGPGEEGARRRRHRRPRAQEPVRAQERRGVRPHLRGGHLRVEGRPGHRRRRGALRHRGGGGHHRRRRQSRSPLPRSRAAGSRIRRRPRRCSSRASRTRW